jgi:acyl-CoA synthetase (NDP forming)
VLGDDAVDSVLVVCTPSPGLRADALVDAIEAGCAGASLKPVVASIFGPHPPVVTTGAADAGAAPGTGVPVFDFPDAAAYALGKVTRYALWRSSPEGVFATPSGVDVAAVREAAATALAQHGEGWLPPGEVAGLLRTVGLDPLPGRVVGSIDEAVAAARELGYPVAVKQLSRDRLRAKSEAAGLALDVYDDAHLRATCARMVDARGDAAFPVMVQCMATPGVDVAVALADDPLAGPVLTLNAGGVATPVSAPRVQVLPLTDLDARRCIETSPVAALLDEPSRARLEDVLLRIGALSDAAEEVAGLELNPVIVTPTGASIADATVRLVPVERDRLPPVRRL